MTTSASSAGAAAASLSFKAFEDFALSLNELLGGNETLLTDTLALLLKSSDGEAVRGAALEWCLKKDGPSSAWPISGPSAISRILLLEAALQGSSGGEEAAAVATALSASDREQLLERARSVLGEAPAPIALRLAKATAQELGDDSDASNWLRSLTWSRGAAAEKQKASESEDFEPAGGADSVVVAARAYCRAASALLESRSGPSAAKLRGEVWKVADDALKAGDSDERRVVIQLLLPAIVNKGPEGPEADAQRLSEVVGTLLERGGKAEVADALALSVAFHEVLLDLWKLHSLVPATQDLGVRLVRQGLLFSFKENANLRKQARFLLETATRRMLCIPKVDETLRSQFSAKGSEVEAAWKAFWEVYESLEDFASHILKSSWEGWLQRMLTFLTKLKGSSSTTGAARTLPPTVFSPMWFEVLLVRALGHDNDSVHKFVMGQAIALDQSVVCLSENFVLGEMLPRLSHSIDVLYPRSDVHRQFEKRIIEFFTTFVRLHPEGPAVAAKRLLLGTLGTRALHHTPLRLMLSVLVHFDGAGAVTPSECTSICLQFFNDILGRMPVSSRAVISPLFLRVMEHLCQSQSEDPTADVDVDAATALAASIPDSLLEDLLPLLATFARKSMGEKAPSLLVDLLTGLASSSGSHVEPVSKAEAIGRAASPTSAIRMTLGCVRLLVGLAQEAAGAVSVADLVFAKQLWPAVSATVGEIHRRSYLPQRSAVTALFACVYATALLPDALPLLMSENAAVEEMLAYAEAHARRAVAGAESEVEEETSWTWLYALVFERCWSPGLPHGTAVLELTSQTLQQGTKETSLSNALALTAATTLLAALAPKVESATDRAKLFFVLWKAQLRKPASVVDSRFSVSNTDSLDDWKRNRLEEYEDLHRVPREGLGRLCEWRDAIALFLLAKWRALAQLATSTPEAVLAEQSESFAEFCDVILDELEAMQPPTVAYWTVVARRAAYPALFGTSSSKDEEWQKAALRRLCNGLQGSISEGTGDGSQYMCKGVMVELAAALCDPVIADAQKRLFPASEGEGPLTKSTRMLLNLGEVAVAVSRAVAPPLLAALLHSPDKAEGESAAFILGELLLHREATIIDGALSVGPELAAGVVDKESPGSLAALQAVCPAASQLREKFSGTSGLPRLLALTALSDLAERGRQGGDSEQAAATPAVVAATLRRLFVVMRETLATLLNPPGSKVVANRPPTPMPMSDTHRTQLRGWQALLALGRHADRTTAAELLPELFYHLNTPHVPDVRDCQELLGCALCSEYEDLAVEQFLVPALRNFDAATQVSASLLVIAIYLMKKWADDPRTCDIKRANELVNVVAPYLSHNSAYVRGTASWGFFELFKALGVEQLAVGQNAGLLKDLYDFIASSKECKKMRARLKPVFVTFDPCGFGTLPSLVDHCTVLPKADLEASCNEEVFTDETNFVFKDGELQPVNTFMNGLKEEVAHEMETLYERSDITQYPSLSDNWKSVLAQAVEAASKGGVPAQAAPTSEEVAVPAAAAAAVASDSTFAYGTQRKFVPLEKPIPPEEGGSSSTKRRLPLIVIASLIDKTPNLAGLCRTCEVFNCEAVCLANQKIIKDQTFQSISVTAEKWLPVKEVPKAALKGYLSELRRRGYQIVGIEQTHNSVTMDKWKYSGNTAILLGAEKEGIDADLLPWLDACVEIPQAGQIRSLNVHVSGSLAVWEYTRQLRTILDAAAAANAM